MDLKEMMDGCGGPWTEERHSAFLNWVEESFVRRVLTARGNDPGPHLDLDVELGAYGWLPPPLPLPLDRFLPDSATESNRNPGRPARPARTRRSATMAGEAEEPEEEEESVVTSRHRKRKPQPLLSQHKCLKDQLGSTKPDGITSHKMKAGEAGASQIAQRDTNTTLSKKRSASNRSVGAV
ncbi:hypothetical protein MUK42_20382 [Musa troglodytarum]|uniref:Uncharacterized protein n=1 Tax=Musa troglodytarum TaxID=320322 RepID=A0A9E7K6C9_9LILI|nr:hypothetical protein MUK42_20382 [Musa troglodytarum]